MNKKQYEAKRNQLLAEAQKLIDEGKAEEANAKMQEITALDDQWDAIAQAQANFNALNKEPQFANVFGQSNDATNMGKNLTDSGQTPVMKAWESNEYKTAWAKNMMGLAMTAEEQHAFSLVNEAYTHTTGNTAIVIPKTVSKGIWEEAGAIYPYFGAISKSYVNGVLTMIQEDTSSDSGWYEEGAETEDGKETFKEFTLAGCELSRSITVSWKLKEMAIEDFIPYIQRRMAKKMGAALGYGATHGKGAEVEGKPEPIGVVTALEKETDTPQIVTYAENPTYKDITATRARIKSGYGAGLELYANNSTIWNQIANIVDVNKRPIFIQDPTSGGAYRVLGMLVKEDASMLDGEILMSNAEGGYHMNINKEMTMMTEEHVKARKTDYCGYAIADGNVTTTKAHALLKKATV